MKMGEWGGPRETKGVDWGCIGLCEASYGTPMLPGVMGREREAKEECSYASLEGI